MPTASIPSTPQPLGPSAPQSLDPTAPVEWNADPNSQQPFSPQVYVDRATDLIIANFATLRGLLERYPRELKFGEVMECIERIDDARRMSLAHIGMIPDHPLVKLGRLSQK